MPDQPINIASAIKLADIKAYPTEAIAALVETVLSQEKEIRLLQDNSLILFDLVAKLEAKVEPEPSKSQVDKAQMLKAILATNGRKMMAQDARKRLNMDKASFSRLLSSMSKEITIKKFHGDRRRSVIILNG